MSSQLSSRRDRQIVRILSLLDGISYFPHGKSEMLRRKSEMLRGIWHFLRGKREMPHGFRGFRVEKAKCCTEFGIFSAEKRKCCTDFAIFCVENAKCRTEFSVSARKKRNAVRNLGFSTRKMRNAPRSLAFSARKKEILRGIRHFPREKAKLLHGILSCRAEKAKSCEEFWIFCAEKGEIPIRLSNLEFSGSKVPFACVSTRCPISEIRRRNGLYAGERKFSVTEIRFPGRHSPREPSRAKPQTEPQAGSNGFAFSKQKMRKAEWPLGDPHVCPCGDPSERCRAPQLMAPVRQADIYTA